MRFLSLGLTACLVLCLWVKPGAEETNSGPRLVIEQRFYDFGKVKEGERVSHAFRILNKGDQVLTIGKVRPD